MSVDVVALCSQSEAEGPQGFFIGMAVVFAFYLGVDTLVAALVVRRKLSEHVTSPSTGER